MMEFLATEGGMYVLSLVAGIGMGLLFDIESRRSWVGTVLVVAVFILLILNAQPGAAFTAPLSIVALGLTTLLSTVARYSQTALLVDEPYWRKVVLTLTHGRQIRSAARTEHEEARTRS